jgi:hypothetical protein
VKIFLLAQLFAARGCCCCGNFFEKSAESGEELTLLLPSLQKLRQGKAAAQHLALAASDSFNISRSAHAASIERLFEICKGHAFMAK